MMFIISIQDIVRLVDQFLTFEIQFDVFEKNISDLYLNGRRDSSFTKRNASFFYSVYERLEWTVEKLGEGDLELGYVDQNGFRDWLRWQCGRFKDRSEIEHFDAWDQ
jgi:hypothetical protein